VSEETEKDINKLTDVRIKHTTNKIALESLNKFDQVNLTQDSNLEIKTTDIPRYTQLIVPSSQPTSTPLTNTSQRSNTPTPTRTSRSAKITPNTPSSSRTTRKSNPEVNPNANGLKKPKQHK